MASSTTLETHDDQSMPSGPSFVTRNDGARALLIPSTPMHAAGSASDPLLTPGEETLPYPEPVSMELPDPPPLDPYQPYDILEAQPRQMFELGTDLENRRRALVTEARRQWNPASLGSQGNRPDRLILTADDSYWYTSVLKQVKAALRPLVRRSQQTNASVNGSDILVQVQTGDFAALDRSFETILASVNQDFQDEILRLTPLPKFVLADRLGRVPLSEFVQAAALYREDVESFLKTHLLAVQSSTELDQASRQRQRRRTSTGTSSQVDLSGVTHISGTSRLTGTSRVDSSSPPAIQSGAAITSEKGNSYRASAPVRGFKELPPHLTRVERLRLNERTADSSRISDISREFPAGKRMGDLFSPPEFPRRVSDLTVDPPTPSSTAADAGSSLKRYRMGRDFPATGRPQAITRNRPSFSWNIPDISEEMETEAIGETDHSIQLPSSHRRMSGTIAPEAELRSPVTRRNERLSASSRGLRPPPSDGQPLELPRHSPPRHPPSDPHSPGSEREDQDRLSLHLIRDRFYNEVPQSPSRLSQPTEMSHRSQHSILSRRSHTMIERENSDLGSRERDFSVTQAGHEPPSDQFEGDLPPHRGGPPDPGDSGGDSGDSGGG